MENTSEWFLDWFNEDYLNLYAHRDKKEAEEHVDFLIRQLNLRGSEHILDLACGSGRHSILFGNLGYRVQGIDTSEFLIHEAVKQSTELPKVQFLCRDMRNVSDLGPFDLILSMFTSFGYFDTDEENLDLLRKVSKTLKRGGLFFIDYLNAEHVENHFIPQEKIEVNGEEVTITREIQEGRIVKSIDFPNRSYKESVMLYTPESLSDMLERSGFDISKQWGNYNGEDLTPSSERILTLSKLNTP